MFGISFLELIVILAVVLLIFGPEKLPDIARSIGKVSADLRRASEGVRREFYNAMYAPAKEDLERAERELRSMREKLGDEFKPHPLCPDTIAKQAAQAVAPEAPPAPAQALPAPTDQPTPDNKKEN